MSWSVSKSGTPDEIVKALEKESTSLSGQSKVEFDEAKPSLVALVQQNFNKRDGASPPTLTLSAYGSGSSVDGEQVDRSCEVKLTH
jgi:hypothetical protein